MMGLWQTPLPGVLLTLLAYALGSALQRRARGVSLLNPVLVSIALVLAVLKLTGTSYASYFDSAAILHFLLGPATIALAVPLAQELRGQRQLVLPIVVAVFVGSLVGGLSTLAIVHLLGGSATLALTMAPKSVTAPIAMGIAEKIAGLPPLTAALVILTGILGAMLGPGLLDRLSLSQPAVRGVAVGTAAHGIGTAAIYQQSEAAGAYSGLAMGLSGLLTALWLPLAVQWLGL